LKPSSTPKRLVTIDALRAFAATAVVLTHISHHEAIESNLRRALLLPFDFGYLGVTLFLVISGFCIHLAASVRPGGVLQAPSWGTFWKRRFYRLYPAYVAAAGFSYVVYRCLPSARYSAINQVHWFGYDAAAHALLIHNLFANFPFSLGNGVFWTLGLEEQLYALYAIYVVLRRKRKALSLVACALAISLLWRVAVVVPFGTRTLGSGPLALGSWWTWPFGWWFCWIIGAVAAEAYAGVFRLPRWCFNLRVAAVLAVTALFANRLTLGQFGHSHFAEDALGRSPLWWSIFFRVLPECSELAFAVCFFICINYLVGAEQTKPRGRSWLAFARLGRMSYSLYLTHVPIVMLVESVLPSGSATFGRIALKYAVLVPLSLSFGWVYFWAVERNFLIEKPSGAVGTSGAS